MHMVWLCPAQARAAASALHQLANECVNQHVCRLPGSGADCGRAAQRAGGRLRGEEPRHAEAAQRRRVRARAQQRLSRPIQANDAQIVVLVRHIVCDSDMDLLRRGSARRRYACSRQRRCHSSLVNCLCSILRGWRSSSLLGSCRSTARAAAFFLGSLLLFLLSGCLLLCKQRSGGALRRCRARIRRRCARQRCNCGINYAQRSAIRVLIRCAVLRVKHLRIRRVVAPARIFRVCTRISAAASRGCYSGGASLH